MSIDYMKNVQREEDEFYLSQQRQAARIRLEGKREQAFDRVIHLSSAVESRILISKKEVISLHDLFKDIVAATVNSAQLDRLILENLNPFFKYYKTGTAANNTISATPASLTGDIDSQEVYWALIKQIIKDIEDEKRGNVNILAGSVKEELVSMFQAKSLQQLNRLEEDVVRKLAKGGESMDGEYWEHVIERLRVWRARLQITQFLESVSFEAESIPVSIADQKAAESKRSAAAAAIGSPQSNRAPFENYMAPTITESVDPADASLLILEVAENQERLVGQCAMEKT